jgi:tRNA-dihydrouridine synthase
LSHKFCIAPMMEWSDRHCRMLHRLLCDHARLYAEMVTAQAAIRAIANGCSDTTRAHPVAMPPGRSAARAARVLRGARRRYVHRACVQGVAGGPVAGLRQYE